MVVSPRGPAEAPGAAPARPCPACESGETAPAFTKDGYGFARCAACGFSFIDPPLDQVEIDCDLKLPGREAELAGALAGHGLVERAMVSTMEVESLKKLRLLEPDLRLGWTYPKTRRDWTDEGTSRLRAFYSAHAPADGRLPVQPYLAAAVRHRDALLAGKTTPEQTAAKARLNPRYFATLWAALIDKTPSFPLDVIRARWRKATEGDVPALAAEVAGWLGEGRS